MLALATPAQAVDYTHDPRLLVAVPVLAGITFAAYRHWVAQAAARGGRVATDELRLPDLFFTVGLVLFFGLLTLLSSTTKNPQPLTLDALLASMGVQFVILALFGTFLAVRGVKFIPLFGLRALPFWPIVGRALLFLLAAFPAMIAMGLLGKYLNANAEEQQVVSFFRAQARQGQFSGLAVVGFTAVILAPIMEEMLFRGYFYPTLKRYLNPVASAILVSLLFAASHANLNALPALFVLALCLTVAYERTGSLFVPMTMHALFNSTSLLAMYWEVTHTPS